MSCSDDSDFSNKDLYQQLWDGRNFELSHFWQRSAFLASVFIVFIAAYGQVAFKIFFPENESSPITSNQHFIAWGLTFLCLIFSMLWIMMFKGSKLWYERYEYSINKIFWEQKLFKNITKEKPCHGNLESPPQNQISDSLFSTKAGGYSVSKINIAIGIISMFVFSVLNALHFGKFLILGFKTLSSVCCALYAILQIVLIFSFSYIFLKKLCKSEEAE